VTGWSDLLLSEHHAQPAVLIGVNITFPGLFLTHRSSVTTVTSWQHNLECFHLHGIHQHKAVKTRGVCLWLYAVFRQWHFTRVCVVTHLFIRMIITIACTWLWTIFISIKLQCVTLPTPFVIHTRMTAQMLSSTHFE